MKKQVYEVRHQKKLYALIIKKKDKFTKKGVNFVTKDSDLMQLGFLNHKKKSYYKFTYTHNKPKNY